MDRRMLDGKQDEMQESARKPWQKLDVPTAQYIHSKTHPLEARVEKIGSVITRAQHKVQESRLAITRFQQRAAVTVARLKQLVSSPPGWFLNVCQNDITIPLLPTFPSDEECEEVREAAGRSMSIQCSVHQTTLPLTLTITELVLQEVLEDQPGATVDDIQAMRRTTDMAAMGRKIEENNPPAGTDSRTNIVPSSDSKPGKKCGSGKVSRLSGVWGVGHPRTAELECTKPCAGKSDARIRAGNSSPANETASSLAAPIFLAKTSGHASVLPKPKLTDLRKSTSVADITCFGHRSTCSQHRWTNERISESITSRQTPFIDHTRCANGCGDCGCRDARSDGGRSNINHQQLKDTHHNDEKKGQNTGENPNSVLQNCAQQARTQVARTPYKHSLPKTLDHGKLQERRALNEGSESENSPESRQQDPRDAWHVGTYGLQKTLLQTTQPTVGCGSRLPTNPDQADEHQLRACLDRAPRRVVARTCSSAYVAESSETRVCVRGAYASAARQEEQLPFLVFVFAECDERRPQFLRLSGSYVRKMLTRPKNLRWRFSNTTVSTQ